MSFTLGTIKATKIRMIPSPLSMLILGETGEITHTITGDDIPGGEEVL